MGAFGAAASVQYIGRVFQNNVVDAAGQPFEVEDQLTANAYVEYRFEDGMAADTTVPLRGPEHHRRAAAAVDQGYLGNLYQPYGRYWYASVRKSF